MMDLTINLAISEAILMATNITISFFEVSL